MKTGAKRSHRDSLLRRRRTGSMTLLELMYDEAWKLSV
jgi:hypothetical protein